MNLSDELNQIRVSILIHVIVAVAIGWVSVEVAAVSRSLFSIALGFVVLYVTGFIVQKFTGKKGMKWWFGNGIFIYLLAWFISWTVFFSL